MPKILALAASPRKGGNSDLMLDEFLKGAQTTGWRIEKIYAADLNIGGCTECNSCYKKGECIIQDDMQELYEKLTDADLVVIATPTFFMGPPSQLKAVIDRCQALWSKRHMAKLPLRKSPNTKYQGFLIGTAAFKESDRVFQGALNTVKALFATLQIEYKGDIFVYGVDKKGDMSEKKGALEKAYFMGKLLTAK